MEEEEEILVEMVGCTGGIGCLLVVKMRVGEDGERDGVEDGFGDGGIELEEVGNSGQAWEACQSWGLSRQ